MEAIEKRFGGNTETKKVQKTLLKQQFEKFSGSSSEGLDQIHDRLQKLDSQLEIHGISLSQEDVNLKFLRSTDSHNLAFVSSTSTDSTTDSVTAAVNVFVVGTKFPQLDNEDLKQIDVDNLKEMDLKWQMAMLTMRARSPTKPEQDLSSRPSAPIIEDWVSDSEKDDMPQPSELVKSPRHSGKLFQVPIPVAHTIPLRSKPHSKGSRRTKKACFVCKSVDHLIKDCDFRARKLAHRPYASRDIHKQTVSAIKPILSMTRPKLASSMGFDMEKVECYNYHRKGHFSRECRSPKDSRRTAVAEPQRRNIPAETSTSNALVSHQTSEKVGLGYNSKVFTHAMFDCENYYSSKSDNDSWPPSNLYDSLSQVSPELVKSPRHSGLLSHPPMSVASPVPLRTNSPTKGLRRSKKTCFVCKSETHLIKDCDFHARKLAQKSYASRDIHKQYAPMNHSKFPLHKVSAAAPKSQPVLTTASGTVSAIKLKFSKTRPNITSHVVSKSKSPFRRPFTRHPSSQPSTSPPRVPAAKPSAVSAAQNNNGK
nr:ribonuclease H-like domain-containing protein [Tanacetum cinerariifolium]